jgi:hypothetical protein
LDKIIVFISFATISNYYKNIYKLKIVILLMKKSRGVKRKVSHHKKQNKPLSFFKKCLPAVIVAVLLLVIVLLIINHPATGNTISGNADLIPSSLSNPGFLDQPISIGVSNWTGWLNVGDTWRDLIVFAIVFIIILVAIADMMILISIFSNWVAWIIAAGIAIIGALTGWIRQLDTVLLTAAAGLGSLAIFVEIVIVIVIFIGLSLGSSVIARWAAKRKAQKEHIKAIRGAGEASAAIEGLRNIQKEFDKSKRRE